MGGHGCGKLKIETKNELMKDNTSSFLDWASALAVWRFTQAWILASSIWYLTLRIPIHPNQIPINRSIPANKNSMIKTVTALPLLVTTYLAQDLVFSSSNSQAQGLGSETETQVLPISKCLKLFDMSSSSSSLELQWVCIESNWVEPTWSLARWHSCSCFVRSVGLVWATRASIPDRLAGVLWRAGEVFMKGVGHHEAVELPFGVISVPMSLCVSFASSCFCTSTSMLASFIASVWGFWRLKKNDSFVGSECLTLRLVSSIPSVNLSAFIKFWKFSSAK